MLINVGPVSVTKSISPEKSNSECVDPVDDVVG